MAVQRFMPNTHCWISSSVWVLFWEVICRFISHLALCWWVMPLSSTELLSLIYGSVDLCSVYPLEMGVYCRCSKRDG